MIKRLAHVLREYMKWRGNWDALCSRCGLCCYSRSVSDTGEVVIELTSPCRYLDEETRLCRVFEDRLRIYSRCKRIHIGKVLFNRSMPPSCAYVRTFRL